MAEEKQLSTLHVEVSSRSAESDSIYSKYLRGDIIKSDRLSDWQEDVESSCLERSIIVLFPTITFPFVLFSFHLLFIVEKCLIEISQRRGGIEAFVIIPLVPAALAESCVWRLDEDIKSVSSLLFVSSYLKHSLNEAKLSVCKIYKTLLASLNCVKSILISRFRTHRAKKEKGEGFCWDSWDFIGFLCRDFVFLESLAFIVWGRLSKRGCVSIVYGFWVAKLDFVPSFKTARTLKNINFVLFLRWHDT